MFKDATLFFSRANASLAHVIPAMDLLDKKLTDLSGNDLIDSAVRACASLGKAVINKYYSLTDSGIAPRICMRE